MLNNLDIKHLLIFPVKDAEARKQFITGTLIYLSMFIIPIIPLLFATGYTVRIMRQVLQGEQPKMVDWDDWGKMLNDGARIFGARLIYSLPVILIFFLSFITFVSAIPFIMESDNSTQEGLIVVLIPLIFSAIMFILFLLSFAAGIMLPAAEIHLISKDEFTAAFRIREWWQIFRVNWGGFLLAFALTYAINFVLVIVMQFAMMTLVLICVLPFLMPATMMYYSLIMEAAFAQAYKTGIEQLANKPSF